MELRHAFIGGFALAPWGLRIRICITSYQSPGLWKTPSENKPCTLFIEVRKRLHMFRGLLSRPTKNRYLLFRTIRISSIVQMTLQEGVAEAARSMSSFVGVAIKDLPKSNAFTQSFPPDPQFPTPTESHKASQRELGPCRARGALYCTTLWDRKRQRM